MSGKQSKCNIYFSTKMVKTKKQFDAESKNNPPVVKQVLTILL